MKNTILYILFILIILPAYPQQVQQAPNKSQLASTYYQQKEYEKAAQLFYEMYSTTKMPHYFDYYINCIVYLKKYDEATKILKKQIRASKDVKLQITLGYVYKEMGEIEKANKTYDEIISDLTGSKGVIINIGNLFFNRRELEYAEKTYLKGREILEGEQFNSNLASVYAYMRDYGKMMDEYIAMVKTDDKEVPRVQARINSLLRYDFDNSLRSTVKKKIIKAIQSDPETIAYNRLLIWMYVIEENYEQALNNSIALDRRTNTEELSVLDFTKAASQKKLYEVALKGLNYLDTRDPLVPNSNEVKQEIVRVEYLRYINSPPSQRVEANRISDGFENTLQLLGYNKETVLLARDFAHFLSFYKGHAEQSIQVLEKALAIRELTNNERALLRIELADIYVYDNKLWNATLLYSKIIEANEGNTMADEVKLKKAKLSYYIGDVIWAKAQLDALKASTSKLIANDAMELSLLISANYDLDTITEPIQQFARGDLLLFQYKDSLAFTTFDSIAVNYPSHSLNDEVIMRKAAISLRLFDYNKTASLFENLLENYPFSTSADDAMYQLALLFENQLNNSEKAQELYKKILLNYPGSIYVSDARNRYRNLRGDNQEAPNLSPYENQDFIN
jgi:tetratricopeptide (TPR) repeat protein